MSGPFDRPPKRRFLVKMLLPGVFVFAAGLLGVGLLANDPWITGSADRTPTALVAPHTAAIRHYEKTITTFFHIPAACWNGNTVNDFQRQTCDEFWGKTLRLALLASLPFLFFGIFVQIAGSFFEGLYEQMSDGLKSKRALVKGTVTKPAELEQDWYGWAFCLKPIAVNVAGKLQLRVYVSEDTPTPAPGQVLAIFETSDFGIKRYYAIPYMPHVAVYKGV